MNPTLYDMSSQNNNDQSFLIVGIGASAGGLEAFSQLLSHLPNNTDMAFVLVQHLAPEQESLLGHLLAQTTSMPVITATDGLKVEKNQVYVIPPNVQMTIEQGRLHLSAYDRPPGGTRTIDRFFQSLAEDQKNKAIAIVLSGSNNDGAVGIGAIRAAGGIVFAQNRQTSEFFEMPSAAIATGKVDFVLSPPEIAAELVKLNDHPYLRESANPQTADQESLPIQENEIVTLYRILHRQTGVDFSDYKPTTFQRRLRRRMAVHQYLNLGEYIQFLQEHPEEIQTLYQDILITVTSFFRDEEVYAAIREKVLPTLINQPSAISSIRIWVQGCATGEEAYSMAICLLEALSTQLINPTIQIFGTDISDAAIEIARIGFYTDSQMENVSPERRYRFFKEVEGGYQIKQSVRELCVFARQDLCSDPPFSDIDLLSCRNVLIYFQTPLQKRVLSFFHYSLKPTGFLILGNSESLGDTSDLSKVFDAQAKIYTRQAVPTRLNFDFITSYYPRPNESDQRQNFSRNLSRSNLQQWADQIVLSRYGPAGVIINEQLDILQFRGDTSPYLRMPQGEPSYNLLKMLRPSLLIDLRTALEEAKQAGVTIRREGLKSLDVPTVDFSLEVIPFHVSTQQERCYLVLFEQESPEISIRPSNIETPTEQELSELDPEIYWLRQELATSRQELLDTQTLLQLTIEEKESANQQLIAANEEILSSNEELKSTNEELQTAKEEIQSANEELKTTNEELQNRNNEARHINDDLLNLLNNVNIPILMLSEDRRIRRFTPAAQRVFNLIPSDVGRPISHLRFEMVNLDLENLIMTVNQSLNGVEQEVQDPEGHWYIVRIRPYRTLENQINGTIVTLVDIDNLKQTEQNLLNIRKQLEIELSAMSRVQDLSLQLFSSLDLDVALNEVLDATLQLLGTDMGIIQLYNAQEDILEIVAQKGFNDRFLDYFQGDGSACNRALKEQRRIIIEDVQTDEAFAPHRSMAEAIGFQSIQSTPLISRRGKILGVLSTYFPQPHVPSDSQFRMLDLYGRQASELINLIQVEREKQSLLQEARAAQAESASKDEFLSLLSHELRTPLNSIFGWVQLMEQGLNEEETQQAIAIIRRSVETQIKLIEDLLDVSRIIQERFQIDPQPHDLGELLQQTLIQFQPQFRQKGLQLETELGSYSEQLHVDALRMIQVFSNLLSNALKFTPRGGCVTVRLIDSPSLVQVQVSDTGQGISSEQLSLIFEPFRQVDSSNTRREGGLGLGLFLVRSIVEAHGGTVEVTSTVGQGSTFTLTLPKAKEAGRGEQGEERESLSVPSTEIPLEGLRILLVEDDEASMMVTSLALEQFGATVITANSAPEALEILPQQLLDIIITDVGLPDINGYELMRQVRTLPPERGGQLPAIALTGYSDQQSINLALEVGFQAHMSKPVDFMELVALVASLVQG